MDQFVYKKIGDLPPLHQLTGNELVEVSVNGVSRRIFTSVLFSAGESAYEVAVRNGFEGTEQEWLSALVGPDGVPGEPGPQGDPGQVGMSAYELAVASGFVGDQAQWLASLKGAQGADGATGKSAYQSAVEAGYQGTEQEFTQSLLVPKQLYGSVFITDVVPQSEFQNVGEKMKSQDGYSLQSCLSTTPMVRVHLTAITGHSSYRPSVLVNGVSAVLTARSDAPLFDGYADIVLGEPADGYSLIRAEHSDGAFWETRVGLDTPPQITSAAFISPYPGVQTELKKDDLMSIRVTADQDVVAYEIANSGAFVAASGSFGGSGSVHEIADLRIADRGTVSKLYGFQVRVRKATGSWSQWFSSAQIEPIELSTSVRLCNLRPTITVNSVTYPAGQSAIKSEEFALVDHDVSDYDTIGYASSELVIEQSDSYEKNKKVTYLSGNYNVSNPNLTITATRAANGSLSSRSIVVAIVNSEPSVQITLPAARLRSGGNAGTAVQNHLVTLTSSQTLAKPPSLNAPEGAWADPTWTSNADKTVWTRRLAVHDNDVKGTYSFNSLIAEGLSGLVQNVIGAGADYVIGGFVFRTLTVAGFPNREASIGTHVANPAKLRCTNLSKGTSGSLNFTYQPDITNAIGRYTITSPSGVANPVGDTWYNADAPNATSNTGGTMQIEIEETI